MQDNKLKIFVFYGNDSVKNQSDYKILSLILENNSYQEKQIIPLFEKNTSQNSTQERIRSTNNLLKNFELINILLEITSNNEKDNLEEITDVKNALNNIEIKTIDEFIDDLTK
jgi:hypothetical protein